VLRDFDATLAQDESIERRGKILGALSKLKQICNHPAQFAADNSPLAGRSGKLARLEEMLEEVFDAGEAALIFTQFAEMGRLLRRRLEARFGRESESRFSLRPLVESGGREPGDGSRLSHRADQGGASAQIRVRRSARGENCRAHRTQSSRLRTSDRQRPRLADRTLQLTIARPRRART
jgi:hypothetical protein